MSTFRLVSGNGAVVVDAARGGRLASLTVGGHELLVTEGGRGRRRRSDALGLVPDGAVAGRVRDGRFGFGGRSHQLPRNLPPHSAHGIGLTSAWQRIDDRTIGLELGPPWPFGGLATQRFDLEPGGLTITMTVEADLDMPIMVGWHPWFVRRLPDPGGGEPVEAELRFGPGPMYELDATAIPTGRLVPAPPGPWDNCFTALQRPPSIRWPGLLDLTLTSSCDHWVVYTEPAHALCVEPQSDAPDAFNRAPTVIAAGDRLEAWFRLGWG